MASFVVRRMVWSPPPFFGQSKPILPLSLSLSLPSTKMYGAKAQLSTDSNSDSNSNSSGKIRRRLVLYSKEGCCLCDGLKEKIQHSSLLDVSLEIRDITANPEWEKLYQYEIPVLAYIEADNSERVLPRLSPRLSIEQLQQKLLAMLP